MLGIVVVGIGIVGKVRIRDLLNPLPSSAVEKLKPLGFVSRQTLSSVLQLKQISLGEALESSEVQAAIICLENQLHEEYVRKFLEAGKHVCVEYPMALSAAAAHELWDLAAAKGKILHEEHIELLTADYKQLKREVSGKELLKGTLHFTGSALDKQRTGFLAFSGIARISWLVDLFGELTVTSATLEEQQNERYSKLTAHFQTKTNRPLTWIEERGPDLKRGKNINFHFECGILEHIPDAPKENVGIFMQDLNLFAQKLLGEVPLEHVNSEMKHTLFCLDLAEKIRGFCEAN
ncbi:biliverdin reductase A isoform X2 [Callorhinchus milii]|nr:biliverdin reductase A isoform X2 [Callorhinchus milii]|eukprot:gi/632959771/ref/XP_007895812.1/ PREDICTED: biliverdin reductase A isoform X2 [Callorhinchus milii]